MNGPDLRGKLKLTIKPESGSKLVRYVHDTITFRLKLAQEAELPDGLTAKLRTTIGQARKLNAAIVEFVESKETRNPFGGWVDYQMSQEGSEWLFPISLEEVGFFHATAYIEDSDGFQHWPSGGNICISVQPHHIRSGNTIYCAFTRLFSKANIFKTNIEDELPPEATKLDKSGWTVIPPSGTLRNLKAELSHVFNRLKCKWLHLLPINPTPTTPDTRMGSYGSPFAALNLTSIDPALVEFDRETTGVDQFIELADETHRLGGYLMLDITINHTGWGSYLQEHHPEFFRKNEGGQFKSPGAWGTIWEDLVELKWGDDRLWIYLAEAFIEWCRRGVDGFRCDAGYKVPMPVWRYIVAKVRLEFPDTVFLLEGLGGDWEITESLLTDGGMQWAYSELFQEFDSHQIAGYLDHLIKQSNGIGPLVHYSETHDNIRLAKRGREWSLMRNRLSALTSVNGSYGFTCGVEWLADQRINVHGLTGLNWGKESNIVDELAALNELLNSHPCFADGTQLARLSADDSPVLALLRRSKNNDELLVLINLNLHKENEIQLKLPDCWDSATDLLINEIAPSLVEPFHLPKGRALCLQHTKPKPKKDQLVEKLQQWRDQYRQTENYPGIVRWTLENTTRVTLVPHGHGLLFEHQTPFRVLTKNRHAYDLQLLSQDSKKIGSKHYAMFHFYDLSTTINIEFISFGAITSRTIAEVECLDVDLSSYCYQYFNSAKTQPLIGLLTNRIGGMLRMHKRMGFVSSKYDCVLAANLDENLPSDRWVMVKRMRCWVNVDGFLFDLGSSIEGKLHSEDRLVWTYDITPIAEQNRTDELHVIAEMRKGKNVVDVWFHYETELKERRVEFTVRLDIEDRSFHEESQMNEMTVDHFRNSTKTKKNGLGFKFSPDQSRQLEVGADCGVYFEEEEICRNIPHPVELSRGQIGQGDAYSPGWFLLPGNTDKMAHLVIAVNHAELGVDLRETKPIRSREKKFCLKFPFNLDVVRERMNDYVVRRGSGKTIIAGYPWFLDWGRDTLIAVRGLIADNQLETAKSIIERFATLEKKGTIPNAIFGDDDSNRETSDAPLWFAISIEELAKKAGEAYYNQKVDGTGRSYRDVILSIAEHYRDGTFNGIKMDPDSALIFSPVHFTWMDTNHPAGTKREGYPIEIQALWIRLLRQVARLNPQRDWHSLMGQAEESLTRFYWDNDRQWLADCLLAKPEQSAAEARIDSNLRCNILIAVSLGVVSGEMARCSVMAVIQHLVVPGAVRSLAPLPAKYPHPIEFNSQLLNDPTNPYWGRYEGDENTRRKPAYHNGTAWTWLLPQLSESIIRAWPNDENALKAANSYLASFGKLLTQGCIGQLPEILDGDAPHQQRGCDAQAWSMSEILRLLKLLQ